MATEHFVLTGEINREGGNAYIAAGYSDDAEFNKDTAAAISAAHECFKDGAYIQELLFSGKLTDKFLMVLLLSGLASFMDGIGGTVEVPDGD